ncbi:hypothetical protein BDV96DRAFT_140297 [Lophiotrema nucula]|uniref:U6 small nuclear RNA (adenine-(43)-N(6))-methyltransferase n=1 Tax=Lophiotrema nucula TaxID=690887 RepID=A0A6A5ZT10_9PLEO|nr:hypothetical protein BDV96DRAFT_140297 [Lophiotrema nucula]
MTGDLTKLPPYSSKADFKALAAANAAFREVLQQGLVDFQDPATQKALLSAQLQVDFGLKIDLPDDRLCPPVPNRFNYVAWIQGLVDSTSTDYQDRYDSDRKVTGLDIGTGTSAIYTLLALQCRPNWIMCATDIDKKSFDSAAHNLAINGLLTRTKLLQTTKDNDLIPLQYLGVDRLDFTVCNPPFFVDAKEMRNSLTGEGKNKIPSAACTGTETEMVCEGGEVGFVTRIVNESLRLKDKVTWYSSMLGKLDSAKAIIELLKKHEINNWAVGVLEPGDVTKRWVVAWSFGDLRPRNGIARIEGISHAHLPFPTEYRISLAGGVIDISQVEQTVDTTLSSLDLDWTWNPGALTGIGTASQNVWNRKYRREYEKRQKSGEAIQTEQPKKVELAFRIRMSYLTTPKEIVVEWLKGRDVVLWESFCGMLHGKFKTK